MPVEPREAGRWKRERQNTGRNTVDNAGNGSTRRRDPCPMGMGGTSGLDRAHVGNPGNGELYHDGIVFLKANSSTGLPIFLKVTTNWRAECEKFARSVRWEGRSLLRPYPYRVDRLVPRVT